MSWFVYILLCDQKSYYIGLTHDLTSRFLSHTHKQNVATKEFSDHKLVYHETYSTRKEAERREMQLKKWRKAKKKALIDGNLIQLKQLSKTFKLAGE